MSGQGQQPEYDPIPEDLTDEERRAVERQGEALKRMEALGVPDFFASGYEYGD
ncbi:hypothetical protein [Nocardiopsis alba]|uniref:hypothetical protein n=1 Tax=Nocardiopsis alba TaxID=53437 RepID=UPI0033A84A49